MRDSSSAMMCVEMVCPNVTYDSGMGCTGSGGSRSRSKCSCGRGTSGRYSKRMLCSVVSSRVSVKCRAVL